MAESSDSSPQANSKSPAKARPSRTNPTMHKMVLEALDKNQTPKGLTLRGIKKYISDNYFEKENIPNWRVRNAMKKGLENNEIRRPKSSVEEGLAGHFLLNRVQMALKEKEQKKRKPKPSKLATEMKTVAKSPKAKKAVVATKAAKSSNKKIAKPISPVKSTPKTKKNSVKRARSAVSKTPKSSKADSGGAQAKTASVKKLKKTVNKAVKKSKK